MLTIIIKYEKGMICGIRNEEEYIEIKSTDLLKLTIQDIIEIFESEEQKEED